MVDWEAGLRIHFQGCSDSQLGCLEVEQHWKTKRATARNARLLGCSVACLVGWLVGRLICWFFEQFLVMDWLGYPAWLEWRRVHTLSWWLWPKLNQPSNFLNKFNILSRSTCKLQIKSVCSLLVGFIRRLRYRFMGPATNAKTVRCVCIASRKRWEFVTACVSLVSNAKHGWDPAMFDCGHHESSQITHESITNQFDSSLIINY